MEPREPLRPGGRSARIQDSVHRAVRALLGEADRGDVTIPLIAQRAGVTPSTIYRRWGDLAALLADVAAARLRPDGPPPIPAICAAIWRPGPSNSPRNWPPMPGGR
ncbi:TetR/AcrR family transcriptional regulator [Rhodospirillum rubrum]|uniref:TetR/AcrR family transcriptional regulator n=1 Tax=Rhodospirillum rubrum TaxID=1085 RepID=UPI001C394907|nr:TetR/AcrR family transcriptional regulator [Rhodospirillum rubrum]QXG79911.1 TetR/AcrR family transcriptional regulator [Rhodospirillum rubrum]